MADTTFVAGTVVASSWLNDVNKATYREALNVTMSPYGAVGDGTTDDTAAIQAAITAASSSGKSVFLPAPSSYYKITSPLNLGSGCHIFGEQGYKTIIRNTSGTGQVININPSLGGNGNYILEHLRIGGTGSVTGLSSTGVVYTGYVSYLTLTDVHFEADLAVCINANLIVCDFNKCTFGYWQQTSIHASHQHLNINGGAINSNVNILRQCKFNNAKSAYSTLLTSGGLLWRFELCDWSNCVRALSTSNITGLELDQCYTEGCGTTTGQIFDFGASRTKIKITGGQFNGGAMAAGVSMFGATPTTPLLVEGADVSTTAAAYTYIDSSTLVHAPVTNTQHFKDCRLQGNATDPLLWLNTIIEGNVYTYVPVPVGLTIAGAGTDTYLGSYIIRGRQVEWTFIASTTGARTIASVAGTSYFPFSTAIPAPISNSTGTVANATTTVSLGVGIVTPTGRFYTPVFGANASTLVMSGSYYF
jgi:hypothetical protein